MNLWINDQGDCLLGQELLHPAQGAMRAAREDLGPLLAKSQPGDTLVLAGLGLGWHARAALEHPNAPNVLVYEPNPQGRALAVALGPELPGVRLALDLEQLAEALGERLVYAGTGRVAVYGLPAYRQVLPGLCEEARLAVEQGRLRAGLDRANRQAKHRQWWRHLVDNFKLVLDLPDVSGLAGAYAGRPALVVGAGPSLDQSLPWLVGCRDKALVLAASSALGPLARLGVAPHLALALEAKDESRQFAGADPSKTLLAAASSGSAAHFANWPGLKSIFHLQPWVAELVGTGLPLPSGGHVTSAAFALAILMGCDPVILVGQDLAYSGGRSHAQGVPGRPQEAPDRGPQVEAIGGGQVETSEVMLGYITWYQEAAAYLHRGGVARRVINASAQGARLGGFEHLDLARALASLPAGPQPWPTLVQALSQVPRPAGPALGQRLRAEQERIIQALASLREQGLEACLALKGQGGALAAALQELPAQAGVHEAEDTLKHMLETLLGMEEGLHA